MKTVGPNNITLDTVLSTTTLLADAIQAQKLKASMAKSDLGSPKYFNSAAVYDNPTGKIRPLA